MAKSLGNAIKQLSQAVNDQSKPTDIRYGTVVSANPLKVQISAELTIPQSALVVPKSLTDYTVSVSVNWNTGDKSGGAGESAFASHNHSISGTKSITIHNALKVGDKVLLLRQQGGQAYIVLDKI